MENYDPIAHLDFEAPSELTGGGELLQFESFEDRRIKLVQTFIDRVCELDDRHGRAYLTDPDAYFDRLTQLEIIMHDDMENFGLNHGDWVQASVPNIIYPAGFTAEFDAGEVVRARVEGLAIYSHYDVAADGESAETLPFGMNISITEPTAVGLTSSTTLEGIGEMNPLISLHHPVVDLHRLILPD